MQITVQQKVLSCISLKRRGDSGLSDDVDYLMQQFSESESIFNCKLLDFALGLVQTNEGMIRIEHYLFNGTMIQRNYAALYFKRLGRKSVLTKAVRQGKIDVELAFSK